MTPRADILAVLAAMAETAERDALRLCDQMRAGGVFQALDKGEPLVLTAATAAALASLHRHVEADTRGTLSVRDLEVLRDVCALRVASLGNYPGELSRFVSDARVRALRLVDAAGIAAVADARRPAAAAA